jgi:hypothetical protein
VKLEETAGEREVILMVAVAGWKAVEAASATSAARRRPCRALLCSHSPSTVALPPEKGISNCFSQITFKNM